MRMSTLGRTVLGRTVLGRTVLGRTVLGRTVLGLIVLASFTPARAAGETLFAVAGSPTAGVAVGDGVILFSSTIHQFWDAATGADSTLAYTAVVTTPTGFVACADDGSIWVSTTQTGNVFVRRSQPSTLPLRGMTAVGSSILAVGDGGTILRSQDANYTTWTTQTSPVATDLYAVTGNGLTTVAVGAGGVILKGGSTGTGWQVVSVSESRDFYGVSDNAPNGQYLAVGAGGAMWRGLGDGVTWTNISGLTLEDLRATVSIGNPAGQSALIVGGSGVIFYSNGGYTNWTEANSPSREDLSGVAFTGNDLVAVGANTTTLWSQVGLVWSLTVVPADPISWGSLKARYHSEGRATQERRLAR